MIYTTNAVQALHRSLRKIIKTRDSFPNDDAPLKLLNPASKNAGLRWRRGVEWTTATGQFVIEFSERFPRTTRRSEQLDFVSHGLARSFGGCYVPLGFNRLL